ncbi:hypothetical protein LJ361_13880 [Brucella sp. JSBI001]|nr:hypothetical protein [Brucella sp. JSBI001]UZD68250.1 hypothetical protein LJ361_13880 [Brucella sp. JSBI001]
MPVIIIQACQIHYVNQALLDLTGYESLDDIRGAGGVDNIQLSEATMAKRDGGIVLRRANGGEEPVDAPQRHFHGAKAATLMLSLVVAAAQRYPLKPLFC